MMTRLAGMAAAALAAVIIAACTASSGTHTQPAPSSLSGGSLTSRSSPTPSDKPVDSRVHAATIAYIAFTNAVQHADENPMDVSREQAIKAHAIDPALANEGGHLVGFRTEGIAWSGHPPAARVSVAAVDPAAQPYPIVVLVDCPTVSGSWKPYDVKTHQQVPVTYPKGSAPPPHASTATVVSYHSRWVVQKTVTNVTKTCAPS